MRARGNTYDIINARVRLSRCLYSRRYYETPSENVLRFVSPFILFCFNRMGGTKPGHTHTYTHYIGLCAHTYTHTHIHTHSTAEMSNRRLASLSLSFCRARRVRWEALYVGKNSSSGVILVHVINRAFQCCSTDSPSLNRVVQTSIPLNGPWNFKLFSTSLQSIGKSISCEP